MSILIKGALLRGEVTDILIEGKYIREWAHRLPLLRIAVWMALEKL